MPTIEIHGFMRSMDHELLACNATQKKIWEALDGAAYIDQVLISYGSEVVASYNGGAVRYLRVWFAKDETVHIGNVIERLAALKLRIECATFAGLFVPSDAQERLMQDVLPFTEQGLRTSPIMTAP